MHREGKIAADFAVGVASRSQRRKTWELVEKTRCVFFFKKKTDAHS